MKNHHPGLHMHAFRAISHSQNTLRTPDKKVHYCRLSGSSSKDVEHFLLLLPAFLDAD
jgi:hypothetical protein